MKIRAERFESANLAIQHTHASGRGVALTVNGMYLVAEEPECDRMAAAGVQFGYLCHHEPTGRVLMVPVN